jgi:hypothetical protein
MGLRDTGKRRAEVGTTGQQVKRTLLPIISNIKYDTKTKHGDKK